MSKVLTFAIVAALVFGAFDEAAAARKKRTQRATTPAIERDYDGTSIIMKGFRRPPAVSIMKEEPGVGRTGDKPSQKADRPPRLRSSSGYVAPAVLPNSTLPAPALTQPGPGVYQPPPIRSYGDRVRDCIHSYPLNAGIGNNPTDQQSYIRQCAN